MVLVFAKKAFDWEGRERNWRLPGPSLRGRRKKGRRRGEGEKRQSGEKGRKKGKGKVPSPLSPIPFLFSLPHHPLFDACPGPGCFNKNYKFKDWYDSSTFKPVQSTQPTSV